MTNCFPYLLFCVLSIYHLCISGNIYIMGIQLFYFDSMDVMYVMNYQVYFDVFTVPVNHP